MRKYNVASTYVAPQAPVEELDPLMQHALTQTVERDVWVPLFENIFGSIGLFVAFVCGRLWWIEYETSSILISTGYWAGIGMGVACMIRFWGDECKHLAYHWSRGWAEGRTHEELEGYKKECERLAQLNRELRTVNAQMVRKVGRVAAQPERVVVQDEYTELQANANKLCRFFNDHGTIAREKVLAAKLMSKSQWEDACNFLQSAGVTVNRGMLSMQAPMARIAVQEFVDKQRQAPSGFVMPDAD